MELPDLFNETPFVKHLGIEVTEASDGYAEASLPFSDELRSNKWGSVAHGGATYALADTAGGAAVISLAEDVSPTVDMRIDYLAPATSDLRASAEVIRFGSSLAMVQVDIHDEDGNRAATAQGTYKTSGQGESTPWRSNDAHDPDDVDRPPEDAGGHPGASGDPDDPGA
jgi:uncharacterized protein (TIGR00369 family)